MDKIKTFFGFFPKEEDRIKNVKRLKDIALDSYEALINKPAYKSLTKDQLEATLKDLYTDDVKEILKKEKKPGFSADKSWKDIVFHFFAMNENWPVGRCLMGAFMVHLPEYPTYIIPAFSQAKATGEAKELKKGEGIRGLLTGGLEGVAIGALVSGQNIKIKEMGPYILLGAGLQLFSSTVFPWVGEKIGRSVYLMNKTKDVNNPNQNINPIKTDYEKPKVLNQVYSSNITSRNNGLRI